MICILQGSLPSQATPSPDLWKLAPLLGTPVHFSLVPCWTRDGQVLWSMHTSVLLPPPYLSFCTGPARHHIQKLSFPLFLTSVFNILTKLPADSPSSLGKITYPIYLQLSLYFCFSFQTSCSGRKWQDCPRPVLHPEHRYTQLHQSGGCTEHPGPSSRGSSQANIKDLLRCHIHGGVTPLPRVSPNL